jgi:LuxR family transcriptional regulator, maltose regulon positive regulatory protein
MSQLPPSETALVPAARSRNRDLVALIERATRHQVTLVCGPGGIGKTLACSLWAARQLGSLVVWLTLNADDDQALFWARVYGKLLRGPAVAAGSLRALADVTGTEFPLHLAEAIRTMRRPVVLVVDNVHDATSELLLAGLEVLVRNAPPNLRIVLSGRHSPAVPRLARLRAAGELAVLGPAELACPTRQPHPGRSSVPSLLYPGLYRRRYRRAGLPAWPLLSRT